MAEQTKIAPRRALNGQVIEVINNYEVVINKGAADGVTKDDRFLLYKEGKEMFDPENGEYLGRLELVYGTGKPKHIQDRFTTLESAKVRLRRTRAGSNPFFDAAEQVESIPVPFEKVEKGCLFKQIR